MSYNSAVFNLREDWTSELVSACLRLDTVHFPMGGIVGRLNGRRILGNRLGFSPEVAGVGLDVFGGKWLLKSKITRETKPLLDCVATRGWSGPEAGWLRRWDRRRAGIVSRRGGLSLRHGSNVRRANQMLIKPLKDRGMSAVFLPMVLINLSALLLC